MTQDRVEAYILAGGLSSRMGRDKAMLTLGGKTLLGRAVEMLRSVEFFRASAGSVRVTIVGDRTILEGADRTIADRYPRCGPLGGMEAALSDLNSPGSAEWAFFVPVDMPFLPAGLVDALLREWVAAGRDGTRACHVVDDTNPQPLVSLVHRTLHPFLVEALKTGQLKVTPVMQSASTAAASSDRRRIPLGCSALCTTTIGRDQLNLPSSSWSPDDIDRRARGLWFANLNTEEDLLNAETFLSAPGSIG